ncbi:MAG: ABC transporter ATP-binding protein [Caldilineaceae bacterium]|nr:ABC transporter ATP-binding protein [Caldilineaceae bacterium]
MLYLSTEEPSLSVSVDLVHVTKRFGDFVAVDDLSLQIEDGEFFSLLGPSGCGKTTTLRMVAGFEQPTSGVISIYGKHVEGVPAHLRPVNTVFQSYALFPHMTVAENVAFGLEMQKVPRSEITRRVGEALELVQLPRLGGRKPAQLSGGQQQRVAVARALVNRPKVLLLDEPLGALDLKLRKAMQLELKQIQSDVGITFIYVTHDQEEALTMSNRIAVMHDGLVQQVGEPWQIYEHPVNRFVADFIGETNFIPGKIESLNGFAVVDVQGVKVLADTDGREVSLQQQVTVAVRPEKINVYPRGKVNMLKSGVDPEEALQILGAGLAKERVDMREYLALEADNVVVDGKILEEIYIGTDTRYRVEIAQGVEIFVRMQNYGDRYDRFYDIGDSVYVHWTAENATVLTE